MDNSNYICIIADDLTGANDTSLQFFLTGCKTQVAFGEDISVDENLKTEVFAMSTESRNTDVDTAHKKVLDAADNIIKKYKMSKKIKNQYKGSK